MNQRYFKTMYKNVVTVVIEYQGGDLRKLTSALAILAIALASEPSAGQTPAPAEAAQSPDPMVRLEAHNGQTHFKIGDPVVLDMVFSSRLPGQIVDTETTPYLPQPDLVELLPQIGWTRSHSNFPGRSLNVSALEQLDNSPIRVPLLLNRTITFLEPGHYEVTIATERILAADDWSRSSVDSCELCRRTNAVGIDLSLRDQSEEAALVVSLSRTLEETANYASAGKLPAERRDALSRELEAQQSRGDSTEEDRKQSKNLERKVSELASNWLAAIQKTEDARRDAAVSLAYLPGDDAVRAKVRFIADEHDNGGNPIGPILRDGLPSSLNKQLQLALLEAAWRDPNEVPTDELHNALRQAKELIHKQTVTDDPWAGTDEDRRVTRKQYEAEIDEVIATLPLRTESNRAATIDYLTRLAVPNQFNKQQTSNAAPK